MSRDVHAERGDTAVGAVRYHEVADHLPVEQLALIPTARGQGITRLLLVYIEALTR